MPEYVAEIHGGGLRDGHANLNGRSYNSEALLSSNSSTASVTFEHVNTTSNSAYTHILTNPEAQVDVATSALRPDRDFLPRIRQDRWIRRAWMTHRELSREEVHAVNGAFFSRNPEDKAGKLLSNLLFQILTCVEYESEETDGLIWPPEELADSSLRTVENVADARQDDQQAALQLALFAAQAPRKSEASVLPFEEV
jgi:hypothetical protein